eukprot:CAMPEP_0119274200 /NCGR_PEP_ID=MMETSP1329-20130426/11752_1 /TAXON_ID=114041 /ORGANISM="Genus nov. species nov., Strain RCC1024" /LENGTH=208 /DNA_ID=CAMNT_0007274489 /DNA_START=119 /DNA_END=741 /DNA_ORIENTATION=-
MFLRLAALAALAARAAADECSATTAIDGQEYPQWLKRGSKQLLTGGGTRYKFGVAKVYALGLYVEEKGLATLKKYSGKSAKALQGDQGFYDAVAKGSFGKTLLLIFHRAVGGEKVSEAIKDSLADKLDAATLAAFSKALFGAISKGVKAGTRLSFGCGGKSLDISVDSSKVAATADASVCGALMQTYYGPSPVSAQAKDGMAAGFAAL